MIKISKIDMRDIAAMVSQGCYEQLCAGREQRAITIEQVELVIGELKLIGGHHDPDESVRARWTSAFVLTRKLRRKLTEERNANADRHRRSITNSENKS